MSDTTATPRDLDVFLSGLLFFDLVFTGFDRPPAPGTEVWTAGMGSGPGGIANFAVGLSRLGLRTSLAAAFGTDVYGTYCWDVLTQEGIDLSRSRRFPAWHSPVTVSLAYAQDRAMITHGHEPPVPVGRLAGCPPPSRATVAHLGTGTAEWVRRAHAAGSLVFAGVGWDPSQEWDPLLLEQLACCHAFLPNCVEAMRYTRTSTPEAALDALARLVPIAVITCGADGVLATDRTTGESARVPALRVDDAMDATGAGDVFGAGFVAATLAGWPLDRRLRFANLVAGLSLHHFGGALAAPGWAEIARWRQENPREDYAFLDDVLPSAEPGRVRRGPVTIGFDVGAV
ncbi:carbohydrate kinase family protein [Amycolatopsis sp. NPDC058986]|uniref:carbohydrate kinase family protein n=1 Tax=unclassified Amycolatopsis TaxID=2618356 RepID=UPI00366B5CDE